MKCVDDLIEVPFPDCVEQCGLAHIFGVIECCNVEQCKWKFKNEGAGLCLISTQKLGETGERQQDAGQKTQESEDT